MNYILFTRYLIKEDINIILLFLKIKCLQSKKVINVLPNCLNKTNMFQKCHLGL